MAVDVGEDVALLLGDFSLRNLLGFLQSENARTLFGILEQYCHGGQMEIGEIDSAVLAGIEETGTDTTIVILCERGTAKNNGSSNQ